MRYYSRRSGRRNHAATRQRSDLWHSVEPGLRLNDYPLTSGRPVRFFFRAKCTRAAGNTAPAQPCGRLLQIDVLEATITTPGWLEQSTGQLWILFVGDGSPSPITIISPMLFPQQPNGTLSGLFVKGVKHLQDNQGGTRTEVTCCIAAGLSGIDPIGGFSGGA